MACVPNSESIRLYSWWWDSHISPKNSKWLLENLTDMDSKVKSMIKLIEEDADSFARMAEMYYKKRLELMKLVEEFYRAYRALAERYDYATGELRHAQRTIIFSNLQEELSSSVTATQSQPSDDDQINGSFSFEIIEAKSVQNWIYLCEFTMETVLIDCVQNSLKHLLYRNTIFMCERPCSEFPSEENLKLLAACYLQSNQAYSAYHILKDEPAKQVETLKINSNKSTSQRGKSSSIRLTTNLINYSG